ncbi:hypothetical protein HPP92_007337 [Vanilla planifolia]|uniref:Gamma-glutamylcyclotransferase family protein n=1 Tax=Vanilla planifolia TaxID=51239 RepID=A0A835R9Z4_VANPL|nr:hypothetical protein HPP92_007337 [Vanilla planifolia]
MVAAIEQDRRLVFTYGTLKRGFSNHVLMQEMIRDGDAAFLGISHTVEKFPLVCGPYRVPFLINLAGAGDCVLGELYSVSPRGVARMDELEGVSRGHYERLPISVRLISIDDSDEEAPVFQGEAYYAHRSYGEELWERNGKKGFCAYSESEAKGYVKRKDRPQGITFLDQIQIFIESTSE